MSVSNAEIDFIAGVGVQANGTGIYVHDGSHVNFGDVLDRTGSFTIEAIINPNSVDLQGQRIVSKDSGSAGWALSLGDGASGVLRFFHRGMNTVITDASSGVVANKDQHVAAVFDSVADTVTLYIDGLQVAQTTGQTNAITANSVSLTVGADPINDALTGGFHFDGFIREVRIWDLARSQAQLAANMHASLIGSETGLSGYWRLDEQTGATANDSSPSNFDGTLSGDAVWSDTYWQHNANPQLMLSYSLDGGQTFQGERRASLGKIGKTRTKIRFNRLGRIDESGRIWRLAASAAVMRGIIQASIDARPLR
jgi:hypothetical protein